MGGRQEGAQEEGTFVYLWPFHVDVWQKKKKSQYCNYPLIKNKIIKEEDKTKLVRRY